MNQNIEQQDQIVFESKNERYGFTAIPNVVLTSTVLSPTEVRIYAILRRYASMGKAMPSVATICAEANISKPTYNRAIKKIIRSTENPNPEVPLITCIHRKNNTNVYKIHDITDELVEKLKPFVAMEKAEREELKSKHKKKRKRKSGYQNDTSIDISRESQNDTPKSGYQNDTHGVSKFNPNNIDTKKKRQQQQEDVVVVNQIIDQFEKTFSKKITPKQAENLLKLSKEHGKDVFHAIEETKVYHERSRKEIKNPYGAVHYAITDGWDLPEEPTAPADQTSPAGPAYVLIDDSYFDSGFVIDNRYLDELSEFDSNDKPVKGVV